MDYRTVGCAGIFVPNTIYFYVKDDRKAVVDVDYSLLEGEKLSIGFVKNIVNYLDTIKDIVIDLEIELRRT